MTWGRGCFLNSLTVSLNDLSERRKALTFFCIKNQGKVAKSLEKEIAELAESVLSGTDFFLVAVEKKGGNIPEIWIYVDGAERGINMDECAEVSNELSFLMDAHELVGGAYRLNVSSPGLSRPLVDRRQYLKNQGRQVKVKYKDSEGYHKMTGTLAAATDQTVTLNTDEDEPVELSFEQIVEAKIIPSLK